MVAVCTTLDHQIIDASGSDTGSGSSITLDSDCNAIVVFWGAWSGIFSLTSLNWNTSETFTEIIDVAGTGGSQGYGVAILKDPTITTSTIDWDWASNVPQRGAKFHAIFIKDADTGAGFVVDSDGDRQSGTTATAALTGLATDDLILGHAYAIFDGTVELDYDTDITGLVTGASTSSSWTGIYNGATSKNIVCTSSNYATAVAIAILNGAAPSAGGPTAGTLSLMGVGI